MKSNILAIISNYLSGRFSPETEERVQRWIIDSKNTKEKEQASLEYWNKLDVSIDSDIYPALSRVNQRIGYGEEVKSNTPFYAIFRYVAAVIIPLLFVAGGYLYYIHRNEFVEIRVAYGEEQQLFLPDSSSVWLNAGSVIRYPQKFNGNQRTVYLEGEAYFSIVRNEQKPFTVEVGELSIVVLGTRFNVNAYPEDKRITTTLSQGKVKIHHAMCNDSYILQPNEKLVYDRNTLNVQLQEVPTGEADAWLQGNLIFRELSLQEIIHTLERRFDISIANYTNINSSKLYTVKFVRNENIEEILNILEEVIGFTWQQENDKIILNRK